MKAKNLQKYVTQYNQLVAVQNALKETLKFPANKIGKIQFTITSDFNESTTINNLAYVHTFRRILQQEEAQLIKELEEAGVEL